MKVVSTGISAELGVEIEELGRVSWAGEEFEVSPYRYKVLSGQNKYRACFVVEAKDEQNNSAEYEISDHSLEEEIPKKKKKK